MDFPSQDTELSVFLSYPRPWLFPANMLSKAGSVHCQNGRRAGGAGMSTTGSGASSQRRKRTLGKEKRELCPVHDDARCGFKQTRWLFPKNKLKGTCRSLTAKEYGLRLHEKPRSAAYRILHRHVPWHAQVLGHEWYLRPPHKFLLWRHKPLWAREAVMLMAILGHSKQS